MKFIDMATYAFIATVVLAFVVLVVALLRSAVLTEP